MEVTLETVSPVDLLHWLLFEHVATLYRVDESYTPPKSNVKL